MTAESAFKKQVRARMEVTGEKYTTARRRSLEHDRWRCGACKTEVFWKEEGKTLAHDHDCFEKGIDPERMEIAE